MAREKTPTVLVVDDEPDILLLCRVNLDFDGFAVLQAADGESGIALAGREHPDLILLDVMMPGMDGWKVLRKLRDNPVTAEIPVVLMTARLQGRDQIRGWSEGAVDYVTKPFSPLSLTTAVRRALELRTPEDRERHRRHMLDTLAPGRAG